MLVDDVEYGRGSGTTKSAAREEASRRALRALYIDDAKGTMRGALVPTYPILL
jgi:dsRNA-specific ribonuclease